MATTKLGKVSITPKGDYVSGTVYDRLDAVYDPSTNTSYLSLKDNNTDAPTVPVSWMLLCKGVGDGSGGSDNNFTDAHKAALDIAVPNTRKLAGMDLTVDRSVEDFASAGFGVGNNFSKHLGTITDTELLNNPAYPQSYEGRCDGTLVGLQGYGIIEYHKLDPSVASGYGQQFFRDFTNNIWYRASIEATWNQWLKVPTKVSSAINLPLINGWAGAINYMTYGKIALVRIGNTQLTGGVAGTPAAVIPDTPVGSLIDTNSNIGIMNVDGVWSIVPRDTSLRAWTYIVVFLNL